MSSNQKVQKVCIIVQSTMKRGPLRLYLPLCGKRRVFMCVKEHLRGALYPFSTLVLSHRSHYMICFDLGKITT